MVEQEFLQNWNELRPLILARWDRVKPRELDRTNSSFNEVVKLIQSHYNDPKENIIQDLTNLSQQVLKNNF